MATKTATRGKNTKAPTAKQLEDQGVPLEKNEQALKDQATAHDATLDTDPLDPEKVVGMREGNTSEVYQHERRIIADKLVENAAIPVAFNHLLWSDNVRTSRTLQLDKMIHSLKTRGYNPKYPIVVSKKSGNKYLVLCGNRRTEALKKIQELEPEIFKIILPDGKVPALVFENLTEDEEILLRNDHSDEEDRVGLDDEGLFYSIKQLVKAGYASQADIAAKLNRMVEDPNTKELVPNRSFIQPRVNLARLPKFVQDEFIKFMRDGKNGSPVRWSQVAGLFKVYMAERREGWVNGDGPKFTEAWKKVLNPKQKPASEDGEDGEGGSGRVMNKTAIEAISQKLGSQIGQRFMLKVAGYPVKNTETGKELDWGDLDGQLVQAEQALDTLNAIAEHMGEREFKKMMTEITKQRQAAAKAAEAAAQATTE